MDAGGFHELFASGICGRLQPSLLKSPAMKLPERAPLTIFSNGMGHSGWANPKPPLWAHLRKGLIGVSFLMRARKRFSIHRGWVSEASGPCLGLLWS